MEASNTTQKPSSLWDWFSLVSPFSFLYSLFALFFSSRPYEQPHPEGPINATPFPKEVTLSNVQRWLQDIDFEATLNLAEQDIKQNPSNPTTEKIQNFQKTAELVLSKMPQLPHCEDWTPITALLDRVDGLAQKVLPQRGAYLPILRAPSSPSLFTRETFGLGNGEEDCFMNATLQMVFSSPWLVQNIIYGKGQNLLVQEIYRKWEHHYEQGTFTAPSLANPLRALKVDFASGQHDATEFLMELITPLEKEGNPLFFDQQITTFYKGAAAIKEDLKESHQFNAEGGKTKVDTATSLKVILPEEQQKLSMEELMRQTFDEGLPEEGPEIKFEQKNGSFTHLQPERKQTKIHPPPYLFVEVKRHGFSSTNGPYKINNKIDLKETFTIPSECTVDGKQAEYQWVSFALHLGSAHGGHYLAYVHHEKGYHCYNDAIKAKTSTRIFLEKGQQFYLGFAKRIDQNNASQSDWEQLD